MDVAALRALVVETNFSVHGVTVTVTTPDAERSITTLAIWMTTDTQHAPMDAPFPRRDPRRVLALKRSEIAEVPIGTEIEAPARGGDPARTWIVQAYVAQFHDHAQVVVIPKAECCDG